MIERRALNLCYRVSNPDAADYGRVGVAVDVLDEADEAQRTVWIEIDFEDGGATVAFHKDELQRVDREVRHAR